MARILSWISGYSSRCRPPAVRAGSLLERSSRQHLGEGLGAVKTFLHFLLSDLALHAVVNKMRREIRWKTKREDGTACDVRVSFFGGKYKFQFQESISEVWDYERVPSRDDLLMLLDIVQRRFHRRQAGQKELNEAHRLLRELA